MTDRAHRDALPGFERRLLDHLLAETAALREGGAGTLSARRPRRLAGTLVAGVAVAGTLAAVTLPSDLGGGDRSGGPLGALAPATASAAEVRARALAAIDARSDVVIHAVQVTDTPDGRFRSEMWFDEGAPGSFRSVEFDEDGRPVVDSGSRVDGGVRQHRIIDLLAGTWYETSMPVPRGGAVASMGGRFGRMLEDGHLSIVRRDVLAGRPALVLSDDEPGMNRRIWVAADSYLPLRMTARWAEDEHYVITYRWMEGGQASRSLLWPEPPPGARRVPAPVKDPDPGKPAARPTAS